jgi:hypothetical protein
MRLFEYVLAEDRRLDLSDVQKTRVWLSERPWNVEPHLDDALSRWTPNLLALRSVARRLQGGRGVRPCHGMSDRDADMVLQEHLSCVCVWPVCAVTTSGALDFKDYRGLQVFPTYQPRDRPPGCRTVAVAELASDSPEAETFWWDGASLFWQRVFLSLLQEGGPAICQRCGRQLVGLTPKGRPRKQSKCKQCAWRDWRAKQSPESMRERWKNDYKKRSKRDIK